MQFRLANPNTVVSSQLLNFLLHSLSHSLILDPKDLLTWEGVFSKQEPEEIRAHENPSFEKAPKHTLNIVPKHLTLQQLHEIISDQYKNPVSDSYNYWVKKSMIEGLGILMFNKSYLINDSEDEILDRIWKMIPWAFDKGSIVTKR
ncbi:hypothetical protein G6F41_012850 [Rhizopus arrhizus]|nr:hypothetical protein G6F41_012850 [Rhizopus arrhizus]